MKTLTRNLCAAICVLSVFGFGHTETASARWITRRDANGQLRRIWISDGSRPRGAQLKPIELGRQLRFNPATTLDKASPTLQWNR